MNKIALYIILGVLTLVGIIYIIMDKSNFHGPEPDEDNYEIVRKWDLPLILEETSGISWLEENKIACIQDEVGVIFIYNLELLEIEKQIKFGGLGDYEGIAINGETAFALRSDGELYEIQNFLKEEEMRVIRHETPLTGRQNMEGLCLDRENNRLLLAAKDSRAGKETVKGIYAFDLKTRKTGKHSVFKIDLEDSIFSDLSVKPISRVMSPSEISIHPETGEMYILDGRRPKLLITNKNGEPQKLIYLNRNKFYQPEGLTFSPSGILYISNEGSQFAANILEVELKE